MPAVRTRGATFAGRKRVRTGCLTCRKRRRKCDERKPGCQNCELKGFSCEYGLDLTFIQAPHPAPLLPKNLSIAIIPKYSSIKFVVNEGPDAPTAAESGEKDSCQHSPAVEFENESNLEEYNILDAAQVTLEGSNPRDTSLYLFEHGRSSDPNDIHGRTLFEKAMSFAGPEAAESPLISNYESIYGKIPPTLSSSNYLVERPESAGIHYETSLLCHYRYNLAPWIDIGDPESFFGIKLMTSARGNGALFAAILAISATHRYLINSRQKSLDLDNARKYRQVAEAGLVNADDILCCAGNALLMMSDLLFSSMGKWKSLFLNQPPRTRAVSFSTVLKEDLNEPLFSLYFRIDLAAAIARAQAPLISVAPFIHNDGSLRSLFHCSHPNSLQQTFQNSLFLLANCLSLIFGGQEASATQPKDLVGVASTSPERQSLSSHWTLLWADCQMWYNERPVELRPVVEVRGTEVDRIDMQQASSFPILIYSSPLALVSNAVYHITSLFLLTHRPRLFKLVAEPRSLASSMWHAQSIAGIATSNVSPVQWDPILVAGLIFVAKDMTHESQKTTVLEILRMIPETTGMNLTEDIEELKRGWTIADYNEWPVT